MNELSEQRHLQLNPGSRLLNLIPAVSSTFGFTIVQSTVFYDIDHMRGNNSNFDNLLIKLYVV
jgi:hypothetical protein